MKGLWTEKHTSGFMITSITPCTISSSSGAFCRLVEKHATPWSYKKHRASAYPVDRKWRELHRISGWIIWESLHYPRASWNAERHPTRCVSWSQKAAQKGTNPSVKPWQNSRTKLYFVISEKNTKDMKKDLPRRREKYLCLTIAFNWVILGVGWSNHGHTRTNWGIKK